jgi:hypothetical protein
MKLVFRISEDGSEKEILRTCVTLGASFEQIAQSKVLTPPAALSMSKKIHAMFR